MKQHPTKTHFTFKELKQALKKFDVKDSTKIVYFDIVFEMPAKINCRLYFKGKGYKKPILL